MQSASNCPDTRALAQQASERAPPPPQLPHLDVHGNEIENSLSHLGELVTRIEHRAARLMGPTPESACAAGSNTVGGQYEPTSVLDRLSLGAEHFRELLKRLHVVTERLELL
ncbi:MAG: hypothetical protein ACREUG_09055 [Steroidobacteraceae bacterium]